MERKGLRVNVDKTKGIQLIFGKESSVSEVDPCGAPAERVGCNCIQCAKCQRWTHRRCSDVSGQVSIPPCQNLFVYRACLSRNCSVEEKLDFQRGKDVLEEVEKFCHLADMISCYGGVSEAVSANIGSAWIKFGELSGVLAEKQGLSSQQSGGGGGRFVSVVLYQFCCTDVKSGTYCYG